MDDDKLHKTMPVVFFGIILFGLVMMTFVVAVLLFNTVFTQYYSEQRPHDSTLRAVLEALSFVATVLIGSLAIAAYFVGKKQLNELENARVADVCINAFTLFLSKDITKSRVRLLVVRHAHEGNLTTELNALYDDLKRDEDYVQTMKVCAFYEYISYLIRKKYMKIEDVYWLNGTAMIMTFNDLRDHIMWRRTTKDEGSLFEHWEECVNIFSAFKAGTATPPVGATLLKLSDFSRP